MSYDDESEGRFCTCIVLRDRSGRIVARSGPHCSIHGEQSVMAKAVEIQLQATIDQIETKVRVDDVRGEECTACGTCGTRAVAARRCRFCGARA